jgi:hypothetical protein
MTLKISTGVQQLTVFYLLAVAYMGGPLWLIGVEAGILFGISALFDRENFDGVLDHARLAAICLIIASIAYGAGFGAAMLWS